MSEILFNGKDHENYFYSLMQKFNDKLAKESSDFSPGRNWRSPSCTG